MKKFDNAQQVEDYIENMEDFSHNYMTIEDCAKFTVQAEEKRELMYEWEITGTFELECEMREVSANMANLFLANTK
jgi:hypothetical protein